MLTIYVYGKCSTCKQALQFLKNLQLPLIEKEITNTPPSLPELQQMLAYYNGNVKKLFNTSGLLYKEMQLAEKLPNLSLDQALLLLNQHGMLVKRPFLLGKNFGSTGFNAAEWSTRLKI